MKNKITNQQLAAILDRASIPPRDKKRISHFLSFGNRTKLEGYALLALGLISFANFILHIYQFITNEVEMNQTGTIGISLVGTCFLLWGSYSYLDKLKSSRAVTMLLMHDANKSSDPT